MIKKKKNIGIYLDLDNIWGGLLRELGINVEERKKKLIGLLPAERDLLKEILTKILPAVLYVGISEKFHEYEGSNVVANTEVRFIKAFAVFSKLPFINQIGEIQTLLHNVGIEPFPSFIAKDTKDASDRALILEIIEDIFFNQLPIDVVILGSGDIDFYPLVSFFYEHSDKDLYLLSFRNSLSNIYLQIPLTQEKVLLIEDICYREAYWFKEKLMEFKRDLKEVIEMKFSNFKDLLLKKLNEFIKAGRIVKTGLVITGWKKEWKEKGFTFDESEINFFLDRLVEEKVIIIESDVPDKPLKGRISLPT